MSEIETRLKENFPPILMTLVSLMVALVFENMISDLTSRDGILDRSPEALFIWAQSVSLGLGSLMMWWTVSLHAATLRIVFAPRDAFTAVTGGIIFIILASKLGSETATPWMYCFGALFAVAWVGWRDFGRLYAADSAVNGDERTHASSRRVVLCTGLFMGLLTLAYQLGWLGLPWLTAGLLLGLIAAFATHVIWYGEWKTASGIPEQD